MWLVKNYLLNISKKLNPHGRDSNSKKLFKRDVNFKNWSHDDFVWVFQKKFWCYTLHPSYLPYSHVWLDAENTFYFEKKAPSKPLFSHCQDDTRLCLMTVFHFINILSKRFSIVLYIYTIRGTAIGNVHALHMHRARTGATVTSEIPQKGLPWRVFLRPINTR